MEDNEFKVVDTSGADYNAKFANLGDDMGDEFFEEGQQEVEYEVDDSRDDDSGDSDGGELDLSKGTGNEYLDAYLSWADSSGVDVDVNTLDPNKFTAEDMDVKVGRHYTSKYLGNVDPRILDMAEQGVSIDEYMENKANLNKIASLDPIQLFKSQLFEHIKKSEAGIGMISVDENGNTSAEHQKYIMDEVEKRASTMSQERMLAKGKELQEHYRQQINALPDALIKQQQEQYNQGLSKYNDEVKQLTDAYSQVLSKTNSLIVDFSGQAEKDDYLSYMRKNLEIQEIDGQKVVPLLHKLQTDEKFLANTMRLLHMHEKGYFTDIKNSERNAAFKKLSVAPVIGKNKGSGQASSGSFVDTSSADYQKRFTKR